MVFEEGSAKGSSTNTRLLLVRLGASAKGSLHIGAAVRAGVEEGAQHLAGSCAVATVAPQSGHQHGRGPTVERLREAGQMALCEEARCVAPPGAGQARGFEEGSVVEEGRHGVREGERVEEVGSFLELRCTVGRDRPGVIVNLSPVARLLALGRDVIRARRTWPRRRVDGAVGSGGKGCKRR